MILNGYGEKEGVVLDEVRRRVMFDVVFNLIWKCEG